jgi:uncharacterized membrane protein YeiH
VRKERRKAYHHARDHRRRTAAPEDLFKTPDAAGLERRLSKLLKQQADRLEGPAANRARELSLQCEEMAAEAGHVGAFAADLGHGRTRAHVRAVHAVGITFVRKPFVGHCILLAIVTTQPAQRSVRSAKPYEFVISRAAGRAKVPRATLAILELPMWNLPPSDSVLHLLSWVALAAQAMTAALAAGRRSMDWMGVCLLGAITALGGGTLRDVLLGHYPLAWVAQPSLLLLTLLAPFVTIAMARVVHRLTMAFLVLDAIGLVVFTMSGCDIAWQMDVPFGIVIVAGMITGCAGGVLRDILCNDVPLLFRSELYASVAVVTGLIYVIGLRIGFHPDVVTAAALATGLCFRLLAIRYHWEMPKFVYDRD